MSPPARPGPPRLPPPVRSAAVAPAPAATAVPDAPFHHPASSEEIP